jgi:ATP phosphoribosyltransferase
MGKVGLKLNVSKKNLKRVMALLPSLKSPTISSLSSQGWFAVESIVDAKSMRDLIPVLLEAGAQGIIEYPLNKVV